MFTTLPDQATEPRAQRAIDLTAVFDRVVVINLARRADRLERFSKRIEGNWPFASPQRFEAIDGSTLAAPVQWKKGPGAWGCQQSHRTVLDTAIADGVSSLLVLEDDAHPVEALASGAQHLFANVPDDWSCLMLGAEHLSPPLRVAPGVVRCMASIRCHAYAIRGPLMQMLSVFWECNKTDHCDLVLSSLMHHYRTYAPDPLLFGQDAGGSDISPKQHPLRFFAAA